MSDREQERLRRVFRELHDQDLPAPAYRTLADATSAPAAPASTGRPVRSGAPARAAWAAAAAAAAIAVVLSLRDGGLFHSTVNPPASSSMAASDGGEDATLRLAASLSNWEAPTDFLLSTPGAEFLQSTPLLGTGADTLSGDHTDLLQNDSYEKDTEVYE